MTVRPESIPSSSKRPRKQVWFNEMVDQAGNFFDETLKRSAQE